MTDQLDLDGLEGLAVAATPGPWIVRDDDEEHRKLLGANVNADGTQRGRGSLNGGIWVVETKGPDCVRNAAYIAAANPATVLSLITRLRASEAATAAAVEALRPFARYIDVLDEMGGNTPKSGPYCSVVSSVAGEASITIEDFKRARAALPTPSTGGE